MNKQARLIIIPGWGGSHKTWENFVTKIKADVADVHVLDMPCFGNEPCPNSIWGIEQYAEHVKKNITRLKSGHASGQWILLGHSFGGQIAAYVAATYPDVIEKLILAAPALYRPRLLVRRIVFGALAKIGKWIFKLPIMKHHGIWAKRILYKAADSPDYTHTTGIQQNIYKKIIRQDLRHILPNIRTSTLIVWGREDTYVPVSWGARACKQIPNCQLSVIPGGSHGLHLNHAEALKKDILKFL